MNSKITLSLLVAALMLAPMSAFAATDEKMSIMPVQPAVTQTNFETKTIQVTGIGKITVPADTATITFTLQSFTKTYSEGAKQFNVALDSLKQTLAKQGVEASKVTTSWWGFYPEYDYATETPTVSRYNMTRSVSIDLTSNLDKVDSLIDVITSQSTDKVNIQDVNFSYGVKNPASSRQARIAAIKDARERAQEISSLLGVSLAGVSKVEDYYSYGTVYTGYSPNVDLEVSMNFTYKFN